MHSPEERLLHSITASPSSIINGVDHAEAIRMVDAFCDFQDGNIRSLPAGEWRKLDWATLRVWMHYRAVYCVPTMELIDWLHGRVSKWRKRTIEIGSGLGLFGDHLGITMTDNKYQFRPEIRLHYQQTKQPTIQYPDRVEHLDALSAVKKYKPHTVFATWVTQKVTKNQPIPYAESKFAPGCAEGVDWELLLSRVKQIIFVGSKSAHKGMRLLTLPHDEFQFDWIVSRTQDPKENFIAIWNNKRWKP